MPDRRHDDALLDAIKTTERLTRWCGRYTPWTSMDDSGGIWLDITGCQHLFGGERAMVRDMTARITEQGFEVRAAAASTPGAAWAVARYGAPAREPAQLSFDLVAPGTEKETLAPLPVAALRLERDTAEGLRRLGLRRVGALYDIERAPLEARFGPDVLKRVDQALGVRDEPLSPLLPAPSRRVRMTFPDPIGLKDDLWAAFERLGKALMQRLEETAEGVTRLQLTGYRADGTLAQITVGAGRASRDWAHLSRLVAERFDGFEPGFGIEVMILAALRTEPLAPSQRGLSGADAREENLAKLMDRLENRLGEDRLATVLCRERHIPEVAAAPSPSHALRAWAPPSPGGRGALNRKSPLPLGEGQGEGCDGEGEADQAPALPRPLHLLASPEPVEVMAPVPDSPPVLFRWRRNMYRIVRADGPERIAPEWWLEDPARLASGQDRVRDYYRVEDEDGGRYWLFRAGLYQSDKAPKWFLHGVFA